MEPAQNPAAWKDGAPYWILPFPQIRSSITLRTMSPPDIRWIQRFQNYKKAFMPLDKFFAKPELNELEDAPAVGA